MKDWLDVPVGTHACCWFDSPDKRRQMVTGFVMSGLARHERVAMFTGRAAGPALDASDGVFAAALDRGQLLLGVAEDAYFPAEVFDGPARVAEFSAQAQEAVAAGYSALRVYADNGAMPATLAPRDVA